MRVAVVGGGVSGLVAASRLAGEHDVRVFEAGPWIGGHSRTVDVTVDREVDGGERRVAVDLGFIVYNERTYPRFSRLLAELGVATRESTMSFSVRCERTGYEYNGSDLAGLFAQRRNLVSPSHWRMILGILRFHRKAPALLAAPDSLTLGAYLDGEGLAGPFVDRYLLPMVAAIWSTEPARMRDFPARTLATFLDNHGMLTVDDRPQWRTVAGGSRAYVEALVRPFRERIAVATPVASVERRPHGVLVRPRGDEALVFDRVVLACHSDQALRLLADATPAEREVLEAIRYVENDVVLHTDARFLPRRSRARAAWNYHLNVAGDRGADDRGAVQVTYSMNRLQGLPCREEVCVTLNRTAEIDPGRILARERFAHPLFDRAAIAAQGRWEELSSDRTLFAGAYWGFGFHEDGVRSGLRVAARLGDSRADGLMAA